MERKRFRCDLCDKAFPTKLQMDRHLNQHTGNTEILKCKKCDAKFKNYPELSKHRKLAHYSSSFMIPKNDLDAMLSKAESMCRKFSDLELKLRTVKRSCERDTQIFEKRNSK